jgi:hypothetical protein
MSLAAPAAAFQEKSRPEERRQENQRLRRLSH